jgi:hypothetical protein
MSSIAVTMKTSWLFVARSLSANGLPAVEASGENRVIALKASILEMWQECYDRRAAQHML